MFNVCSHGAMSIRVGHYPARIGVRLSPETRAAAQRAARLRGMSLSDFARNAVERAVMEPDPPPRRPARRERPGGRLER
jgi:hypothetical protein